MNVDRIQKVNDLAIDLMKQGLATDREDAVEQARKMLMGRDTDDYVEMRKTMKDVENYKEKESPRQSMDNSEISSEKIQDILAKNTNFLVKKIGEFQAKVDELEKELLAVKTRLTYQRLPTASEHLSGSNSQQQSSQQNSQQSSSSSTPPMVDRDGIRRGQDSDKSSSHPRSGGYKGEDVSIEKFF